MSSTTTPHTNEIGQTFTLAAGDNTWPAMLAAAGITGLALGHVEFEFIVESGGPVAWVTKNGTVAAITEGHQYNVGEGDKAVAVQGHVVDGSQQHFFATGADVLWVRAANR